MAAKILSFNRHARAPSSSKTSNASDGSFPLEARISERRHLCGTPLPGSRHLSNVFGFTPRDIAIRATKSQSSVFFMEPDYSDKSSECQRQFGGLFKLLKLLPLRTMSNKSTHRTAGIQQRIKGAMLDYRNYKGWSQKAMANWLQVTEKNYEKYESSDPGEKGAKPRKVPDHVIAQFCDFTDTDLNWIMLGKKPPPMRKTG